MNKSTAYEHQVADYFEKLGYSTQITSQSGDFGIDVFATKNNEKVAIQAKNYGDTNRKVNRSMIMELHGSKDLFDCAKAILVTSGEILSDARVVAEKLKVELIYLPYKHIEIDRVVKESANYDIISSKESLSFQYVWDNYVIPLKGKTIVGETGLANKIISVSNSQITRITKNGNSNSIPIEAFKYAFKQILEKGEITREEINQEFVGRLSSGVVLVLSNIPIFEVTKNPLTVKLKK